MDLHNFVSKLQSKPYPTKIKILWGATAVIGVVLIIIWTFSLKSEINKLAPNKNNNQTAAPLIADKAYVRIERAENSGSGTKLYFAVNNTTDDILNFPKLTDIKLNISDGNLNPIKLTDRQNKPFVQKILSHTENFGILFFSLADADRGTITFSQLYFERSPEKVFSQSLDLDFNKLQKGLDLRS